LEQEVDPYAGLARFFEELPKAVIIYSAAIGSFAIAAITLRVAAHVFFNV
jgi:hypothetical protein